MSERREIPVLDELGAQLRALGEPPSRPALSVTPRALLVALVLVVLLAGAATAALLISSGPPLPAPNARDLQASGVPLAASARLAGLDAPDPSPGEPAWDLRLSRTAAGETCTAVGQVLRGQFGIVGLDHVFRALPLGGVDACGVPSRDGPVLAGARVFVGRDAGGARTVVDGVAGAGAKRVIVYGPGGPRPLTLGPDGSFLTVYRGYVEEVRPRIMIALADGRWRTVALAQSLAYEVVDPSGLYAWQASGGPDLGRGAYPDENCTQASELTGRNNPTRIDSSLTPPVCGRLGTLPLYASFRRFVRGSGEGTGFPWGNGPPRTLVYGAAAPRVASLTLLGAGAPRAVPIDPHGGVFLVVLDGHADPRALTLQARLRDGSVIAYDHTGRIYEEAVNRPLAEAPVPPYREALPAARALPPPFELPIAGTTRETLRQRDPAGGPEWVLRSWQGRPSPHANFGSGYPPKRFYCIQVGVREGGRLVEPRAGAAPRALVQGSERGLLGGCNDRASMMRFPPLAEAVSFLADPYAYSPRPVRTVIAGQLRPDARAPLLLGAGAPRRLRLDSNRGFLVVLPGSYWDAPLRITAIVKGRRIGRGAGAPTSSAAGGLEVPQARAPDPNGGAPWGFSADHHGRSYNTVWGRILDGRLAYIGAATGQLHLGPEGSAGGGGGREPWVGPVRFDTQGGPEEESLFEAPRPFTVEQIQRRTLPGRTIVMGVAQPDVVSVTIVTPRDVRTLRPTGPQHVLIAVYDGQFFRGAITASVRLRDGRTVGEQVPNGPGGPPPEEPRRPALAQQLRRDQQTLTGMRAQLGTARRGRGRGGQGGPSLATLEQGYRQIAATVADERARLTYEAAHPGLLPAE